MPRKHASRRTFLKASTAALWGAPLIRNAAAKSTAANSKLRLAVVGCGGQGRSDMRNLMSVGAQVVALCDPDQKGIDSARAEIAKSKEGGAEMAAAVRTCPDYRKLLEDSSSFDVVIIGTPDHWHAPIAMAMMKAGKHVYCEKPLTHSVGEARQLAELAASTGVVTQMGNQGSAGASFRRSLELIQAGALGTIREVHSWLDGGGFPHGIDRPAGEDPVPPTLDWDAWVGPAPMRPYKNGVYHPFKWRGWQDFGCGQLGDFACHSFNLPVRALNLTYPERIDVIGEGWVKETYNLDNRLKFHFPARGPNPAVALFWYDGSARPADDLVKDVLDAYNQPAKPDPRQKDNGKKTPAQPAKPKLPLGTLVIGDKGILFTNPWNNSCTIKLRDDARLKDVLHHEPTKAVKESVPRVKSHHGEFIDAIRANVPAQSYSRFQIGGHLAEIALAGVLALRLKKSIQWDGKAMKVSGDPSADRLIHPEYRTKWIS